MATFGAVGSYPASPFTHAVATSMAIPYPSGIVSGAPLIMAAVNAGIADINTPSGWSRIAYEAGVDNALVVGVYTKVAAGTESGSLTVTATASCAQVGGIVRYDGATTTPFGANVTASGATGGTSSSVVTPGTLSPAPGSSDMVVRIYAAGSESSGAGSTITSPGGSWTTRLNLAGQTASTWNSALVIADKVDGTDAQNITYTNTAGWSIIDVVIKSAAVVAPANTSAFLPFFM